MFTSSKENRIFRKKWRKNQITLFSDQTYLTLLGTCMQNQKLPQGCQKRFTTFGLHSKSLLFFPSQIFFWMLLLFDEIFSQVTQADLKTGWLFDHWIFRPVCYTFWKFKTCSFKKTASKINLPFQRILIFFLLLRPSKIKIKKLFWSLLWFSQCSQLWVFDSK